MRYDTPVKITQIYVITILVNFSKLLIYGNLSVNYYSNKKYSY